MPKCEMQKCVFQNCSHPAAPTGNVSVALALCGFAVVVKDKYPEKKNLLGQCLGIILGGELTVCMPRMQN